MEVIIMKNKERNMTNNFIAVEFNKNEKELLDYANSINFSIFCKLCLKKYKELQEERHGKK